VLSADAGNCVFCKIVAGKAPATVVAEWPDAIAIIPLDPVPTRAPGGQGHVLVLPRAHVADAGQDPVVTGMTFARAAELLAGLPAGNLITSKGEAATQTVFHLHAHVVFRADGDDLQLPWPGRRRQP